MYNSKSTLPSIAEKELPNLPDRTTSPGLKQRIRRIALHLWIWELLSLALCTTCVVTIIAILLHYDNKPLPDWPYGLTINGVISVLAGIAKASMILPIAECISQLKWHWFWNGRARPVLDFQYFDAASRGPWGCSVLLFRPRQWGATSLGALMTVAALLMEPSLQFIPHYPSRSVGKGSASLSRLLYYEDVATGTGLNTGGRFDDMENPGTYVFLSRPHIQHGFYSTLYGFDNGSTTSSTPTCSSGNCTWPTYSSLALCNHCTDLGSKLHAIDDDVGKGWALAKDLEFYDYEVYTMNSMQVPYVYTTTTNQSLLTAVILFHDIAAKKTLLKPQAFECRLYFCVKRYTARMQAGDFSEEVKLVWPGPKDKIFGSFNFDGANLTSAYPTDWAKLPTAYNETKFNLRPPGQPDSYGVDPWTFIRIKKWLETFVQYNLARSSGFSYDTSAGIDDSKTMHDLLEANIHAAKGPIQAVMDKFADGATRATRSKGTHDVNVQGTALTDETFVKARWGWAVLPIVLVVLTCIFMIATLALTIRHKVPIWKSSALATLAHGMDEASSCTVTADQLDARERKADGLRMGVGDRPWRLQTSCHGS